MRRRTKTLFTGLFAVAAVAGLAGSIPIADATVSSGTRAIYVPITPCRLFDTRPAPLNVGTRATPVGPGDTFTLQVRGANGNCNIPAGAVGVAMNTTAVDGTVGSFLTVFPADVARPLASSLNWVAGQGAAPNQLNVTLAADGRISLFNLAGTVDVIGDVVGYYEDHNHDDRTTVKSVSFPAESLDVPTGVPQVNRDDGVTWTYSLAGYADLFLHRPVDLVPSSPVTLKLFFIPVGPPPSGSTIQFFARPRDYNSGDPFGDTAGVASDVVSVVDDYFYQTIIVLPANSLPKEWWDIAIQRNQPIAGGFTGSVKLTSIEMSYTAYVVAPGS